MNGGVPELTSARLRLIVPGGSAAAQLLRYNRQNEAHLRPWDPPWTERHFDIHALEDALVRDLELARDGRAYRFFIFAREGGDDVIGRVSFNEIVRGAFQACFMGYSLAASAQGHGYMTEAASAAIKYMFESAGLHRIMANYVPENERSAAVLRRLGFTVEGVAKNYLFIAGSWRDHVLTSLTNPNPAPPQL